MPSRPIGITDLDVTGSGQADVETVERPSGDIRTTTTGDPGTTSPGTLPVTSAAIFPAVNGFKIKVGAEIMRVTAGAGTTSWTVARGLDGTTIAAHASGSTVALVQAVQRFEPVDASRVVSFWGRALSFRTPGRAGTTGQKILGIFNADTTGLKCRVNRIDVDLLMTVVKAITTIPPIVRIYSLTAVPTSGTALTKAALDSAIGASSANITCLGDASADGTSSGTALAATLVNRLAQEFAPRWITAAGYEMFDRTIFFEGDDEYIILNQNEGIAVMLDYTTSLGNPTTDMWLVSAEWEEYTVA